ncbi:Zinc metalloproteinase nas-4 [Dirofilaria immitis]
MAISSKFSYLLILLFGLLVNLAMPSKLDIKLEDIINEKAVEEETTLTAEDFEKTIDEEFNLTLLGIQMKPDPTMGNMTEGDIVLPNFKAFADYRNNRTERSAARHIYRRWPNAEIPYALSSRYGAYSRSVIAKAMKKFHDISCVRFVPRVYNQHDDYIYIFPHDGCYSFVGRSGGRQPVSLEANCIQSGTIIHELMHVVGFFHEQSRPDRDEYIEIMWQNVIRGSENQFDKQSLRYLDPLNESYDYSSIMHYGPYAFSGNGRRTIIALKPGAGKMGQRESLTEIDIRKINKLYHCQQKSTQENSIEDNVEITKSIVPLKPINECTDKSWRCVIWSISLFDYCSSETIANELCPKSCGTCFAQLENKAITATTTTTTTTTTITTTTKTKSKTESIISSLPSEFSINTNMNFGRMRHLTTTVTPITMIPISVITAKATTCHDLDYSCPILVRIIGCDDFFSHHSMKTICPFTCGFCSNNSNNNNNENNNINDDNNSNNKTPKKLAKVCEDRGNYLICKLALFFNECDEKANLCAKTCNAC